MTVLADDDHRPIGDAGECYLNRGGDPSVTGAGEFDNLVGSQCREEMLQSGAVGAAGGGDGVPGADGGLSLLQLLRCGLCCGPIAAGGGEKHLGEFLDGRS